METKENLLTVRISAAHFSVCVFDLQKKNLIQGTYRCMPNTRKASKEIAINSLADMIKSMIVEMNIEIDFCAVSMPGSLIAITDSDRKWQLEFNKEGLTELLAEILAIRVENVKVFSNSVCFLRGALASWRDLENQSVIGIEIGAELGSSIKRGSSIADLNELNNEAYLVSRKLSTSWFLKRYVEESGISMLNAGELSHMYNTHFTAKKVLKEFCSDLREYILFLKQNHSVEFILVTGEISFPTDQIIMLQRAAFPAQLRIGFRSGFTSHTGAGILFHESYADSYLKAFSFQPFSLKTQQVY
jgi:glucokinase